MTIITIMRSAVLTLALVVAIYAQVHSHGHGSGAAATRITGTVVDVACFIGHDSTGPKHAKCAEACARSGNPLAIYDADAKALYVPVSMDHKNPNTKLMPFIEKKVTASGKVIEKAGFKGIAIDSVELAK